MGVTDLVRETYVRVLAGYPTDAVLRASVLAEALLKHVLGKPADAKSMFGDLIGEASRGARDQLGSELLSELNWLNKLRIEAAHYTGNPRGGLVEDAQRAADLVTTAAIRFGLIDEAAAREARRAAEWQASEPASTTLLRLDRAPQRRGLDDLLALSRRVLVMLIHGEVGQGHDHFAQVATWRTRAVPKGQWREVRIDWPAPSRSVGTRLAFLLEGLATAARAPFAPPAIDPATPDGEQAWSRALEPTFAALDRARDRLYLRHVLGWLDDGDVELVARYVRASWSRLAERSGERLVCSLELRRAERGGIPLSRGWRTSRAEQRIAKAIAAGLEDQAMPQSGHCAAIPELTSVSPSDLADWLRAERQLARSAALAEAHQLVTMTRGGRFDLVVQRLASLNLDRNPPR
jgi:hypothetical protein